MEEAFIARLLASAGVTALVANRVQPVSSAQKRALPAVTVTRISGAPLYADDGEAGLLNAHMQVDCWAETYAAAKTLARAVVASLSAFDGTVGGVEFQYVTLELEQDIRESGSNVAEYLYRTSLDFEVWSVN